MQSVLFFKSWTSHCFQEVGMSQIQKIFEMFSYFFNILITKIDLTAYKRIWSIRTIHSYISFVTQNADLCHPKR